MEDLHFWNFSCKVYAANQENLLNLQVRYGLNINVLLFCCWFAAKNRGLLSKQDLKNLLLKIHRWHEKIISPLRRMRDRLKNIKTVAWAAATRDAILKTELTAEQIEQQLLVAEAPEKNLRHQKPIVQRATHACQNMATYCQIIYVAVDENDYPIVTKLLMSVFPELSEIDAKAICHSVLLDKKTRSKVNQLYLELA